MLRKAFEQGIRSIIATPHYFRRHYEPEVRQIYELVSAVQAEADTLTPGLRIYPGQEIMHFYEIEEFLLEKKVITLAGTRYVLIEFLPSVVYSRLELAMRRMIFAGYIPVLAHAERYFCLRKNGRLEELAAAGVLYADELSEPGNRKELFRQALVPENGTGGQLSLSKHRYAWSGCQNTGLRNDISVAEKESGRGTHQRAYDRKPWETSGRFTDINMVKTKEEKGIGHGKDYAPTSG